MKKLILLLSACLVFNGVVLHAQVVTEEGQMSVAREYHQSQLLNNGTVITFGGDNGMVDSSVTYSSAELYSNGIWTLTDSMNLKRTDFASVLLQNGKVLAIGGELADYSITYASCELYDPATGLWAYTDSLKTGPNAEEAAVLLNNGEVLVAGGPNGVGDTAQLYNPTTNTWSKTGVMMADHGSHMTMVLLPSGKVLAVGGYGCTNCGEIYNPSTGVWTATANSTFFPRVSAGAVVLNSGKVLISGSTAPSSEGDNLTSELYDTTANQFDSSLNRIPVIVGSCPSVLLNNGNAIVWTDGNYSDSTNSNVIQVYNTATDSWYAPFTDIVGSQIYGIEKLPNNQVLIIGGYVYTLGEATTSTWLINGNAIPADSLSGIKSVNGNVSVTIAPNPGTDYFTVTTQQPGAFSRVNIYDMEGRLLKQVNPQFNAPVMVTDLAPGMYLLRFYNRGGVPSAYQKWVKQ